MTPNEDPNVDLRKELDELIDIADGNGPEEPQEEETTPEEEAPAEEEQEEQEEQEEEVEEEPEEEPEETDEEEETDEGEEEEEQEEESDEEEEKPSDIDHFRAEMNQQAKDIIEGRKGKKEEDKKEEKKEEKPKEEKPEPSPDIPIEKFSLSDEDHALIMNSSEAFSSKIVQPLIDRIEGRMQGLVRALPGTLSNMVKDIVDVRLAASDFYAQNQDLVGFKPMVSLVADKVFAENPGKDYDELFEMTGKEVRRRLKMGKGATKKSITEGKKKRPASVPRKGRSRKPQPPKLKGMQGEIVDLMELD